MPRGILFTDGQVVAALREVESEQTPRGEGCWRLGAMDTTFFRWKRRFGPMTIEETGQGHRSYEGVQ